MILRTIGTLKADALPLELIELPDPEPGPGELRLRVSVCGVCHTELDEIEGRTPPPHLPIILGHEVVGYVDKAGPNARRYAMGDRLGVGWIHRSSGGPEENLSPSFQATGRDVHGGYAEYMIVDENYAFPIPPAFADVEAAPLLCAGAVGYRSLKLTGLRDGQSLGFTGFGGSAHLVLQLAKRRFPHSRLFVFARDPEQRELAKRLGADWAGATEERAPELLDAVIDTTPAWRPVMEALENLKPGGRLVINAIRKEDGDKDQLLALRYADHLWMEKEIKSVANVTAADIAEFLPLAANASLRPVVQSYPLAEANLALKELKFGPIRGAKALTIG